MEAHDVGTYVVHTGTDVYGPGKVIGTDGDWRRVRFVYFVASVAVGDLRAASAREEGEVCAWLMEKAARHGGNW